MCTGIRSNNNDDDRIGCILFIVLGLDLVILFILISKTIPGRRMPESYDDSPRGTTQAALAH